MTDVNINTPYVIQRNAEGKIINFPEGGYFNFYPNRAQRRNKPERFINNRNTHHLTVSGVYKFRRILQKVFNKTQEKIVNIYHYLMD